MILSNGDLAPATLGDGQPTYGDQYIYPRSGVDLTNAFASYAAVYRTQMWVSTLVNKIAYGTARLPLKVYERDAEDNRTPIRDSPFAQLLRNPNPKHDPFFFWLWTVSTHEVYGEAMWVKVRPRPGAAPTQLWPMHPANVTTYRRQDSGEVWYRYNWGGSHTSSWIEWPAADVVHFRTYNPDNQARGMSRLEPLRQTIVNEDSARRASAAMWSNGGRPSFVVTHPGVMSQPVMDRLSAQLAGLHKGVDNWGKIAIMEEGMSPTLLPLDAESMQYIEARAINREEVCAMYDVPPPVVHILDRATFSNITEQMRSMYRDTMAPRLRLFESAMDSQLRPDFDPRGNIYAEFLLDEVMRGAFEQRAAANQSAIFSGQRTPNEVRKQDNLPPLEGGDKLYINAGSIPLDAAGQEQTPEVIAHPEAVKALAVVDGCVMCGIAGQISAKRPVPVLCRKGRRADAEDEGAVMIVTKAVALVDTVETEDPNGAFEVILSAATLDRDGEVVDSRAFDPLPDHIPFDIDHGMTVPRPSARVRRTTPTTARCGSRARSPRRRSRRTSAPWSPRATSARPR
jgi:HK97 family phage portal protein